MEIIERKKTYYFIFLKKNTKKFDLGKVAK